MCIRTLEHAQVSRQTLLTLQELMACGATWDDTCNNLIAEGKARQEAPALRLCILLWAQQHADGKPFADIPIEVIARGAGSTQTFIESIKTSREVVLRRKICLVGSSFAGKTSFVKSITSESLQPQLEHRDDRTIGIDHFPLRFKQSIPGQEDATIHEVTFWDFAGQDAYQVAHSLFFSPRTMFLLFVDLHAFAIAYMQAAIFANETFQETKLLDEFVEDAIKHWIRMVLTRQPDAEIVFVATKEDAFSENSVTERLLKGELEKKLRDIHALMQEMKSRAKAQKMQTQTGSTGKTSDGTKSEPRVVCVSCTSSDSVQTARATVEELIIQSELSVPMPDNYSQVLKAIVKIREEAESLIITERISKLFAAVDTLPSILKIDKELCRNILQTLHDLGDVLWYEDLGVELFKKTVILDPMLLIDFIRQVITHKHTGQILSHGDLKGKELWIALPTDDTKLMEAMKKLLQYFHLVYSADGDRVMRWNSHLIVPAYWQTGIPASWKFLGQPLRVKIWKDKSYRERVRVRWEYHFEHWLPPQLFNQLVVASVYPLFTLAAGPDWIMFEGKEGATAFRIMVDRDLRTLHQTIRIEAVVADAADEDQVSLIWFVFEHLAGAFVRVLGEYHGLAVSSCALNDQDEEKDLQEVLRLPPTPDTARCTSLWMPPVERWKLCRC
jgi:GTPase SAR1 family protein